MILTLAALLLFVRLGHYALWEDEALTAIPAANVWRTGDMGAMWGRNVAALHDGVELSHLKFRYMPPLQYYLAAPFVGVMTNALGARIPFSLCGLACVAIMLHWIRRAGASYVCWLLLAMAIFGNVSFFLYSRQCRYYALVLLLSTLLAYLYAYWNGRTKSLIAIVAVSILLFASNYLNYFAAYFCIIADYFLFRRREHSLTPKQWGVLTVPQFLIGLPIALIWDPLNKHYYRHPSTSPIADKFTLLLWNMRDLNTNEFFPAMLIAVALVISPLVKDRWLRRGCVALAAYVLVSTVVSPEQIGYGGMADVRYLVALIPMGMALSVLMLRHVAERSVAVALVIGSVAFGSNLLHLGFVADESATHRFTGAGPLVGVHSTIFQFARELAHPPPDPFSLTADWINANIPAGKVIVVQPRDMMYPLIFHAPDVIYGWQLWELQDAALLALPDVHFTGRVAPDYVIRFGLSEVPTVSAALDRFEVHGYELQLRAILPVYWQGTYRPELMLRRFTPPVDYNTPGDSVSIWELVKTSPAAATTNEAERRGP